MSAIAGVCNWDGRPVSDRELDSLAACNRLAGQGRSGTLRPAPWLALQAHVTHVDPLSANETQPYHFAEGAVLTWDGRLDNREDLLLTLHHDLGDDVSDVAIVAAAYARWGVDSLPRFIGDWSLALWDAATQRLLLARDYAGNRPLYYVDRPGSIAWASRLEALADCFDLYSEPDRSYIAGRLTFGVPPTLTPYRSVRALQAGHVLIASRSNRVEVRSHWALRPATLRYRREADYFDRLRELLTEAVRVRLRSDDAIVAHLSGGLDSSSIVCIAHALIQRRLVGAPAVSPLSIVFGDSKESDESFYISAVERWCGLESVRREFPGFPLFADLLGHRDPRTTPAHFTIEGAASTTRERIVLSGELGDLVMHRSARSALLEPLHEGHPWRSLQLCLGRARSKQRPLMTTLAQLAVEAYTPHALKRHMSGRQALATRAIHMSAPRKDVAGAFCVVPNLLAHVPERHLPPPTSLQDFALLRRWWVEGLYQVIIDGGHLTSPDCLLATRRTFPYSHRPLIEFVAAVPQLVLWDPLTPRFGMKRALAGVLPPEILRRTTKGDPEAAFTRSHRNRVDSSDEMAALLGGASNWQLVTQGYLDRNGVDRELDRVRQTGGTRVLPTAWLHLEAWLQTLKALPRRAEDVDRPPMRHVLQDTLSGFSVA